MDVAYTTQGSSLLIALVALQQVWGVDFNVAVERGNAAVAEYTKRHRGKSTITLSDVAALMHQVTPQPA